MKEVAERKKKKKKRKGKKKALTKLLFAPSLRFFHLLPNYTRRLSIQNH
jgi:hypothetical protein